MIPNGKNKSGWLLLLLVFYEWQLLLASSSSLSSSLFAFLTWRAANNANAITFSPGELYTDQAVRQAGWQGKRIELYESKCSIKKYKKEEKKKPQLCCKLEFFFFSFSFSFWLPPAQPIALATRHLLKQKKTKKVRLLISNYLQEKQSLSQPGIWNAFFHHCPQPAYNIS